MVNMSQLMGLQGNKKNPNTLQLFKQAMQLDFDI